MLFANTYIFSKRTFSIQNTTLSHVFTQSKVETIYLLGLQGLLNHEISQPKIAQILRKSDKNTSFKEYFEKPACKNIP